MTEPQVGSRLQKLRQWFDAGAPDPDAPPNTDGVDGVDWGRIVPFALMHLACLFAFYVGVSATARRTTWCVFACRSPPYFCPVVQVR
jgi:hypothetical protein